MFRYVWLENSTRRYYHLHFPRICSSFISTELAAKTH